LLYWCRSRSFDQPLRPWKSTNLDSRNFSTHTAEAGSAVRVRTGNHTQEPVVRDDGAGLQHWIAEVDVVVAKIFHIALERWVAWNLVAHQFAGEHRFTANRVSSVTSLAGRW